jgi:uncharacterized protein YndB with AHSA1/START domain
MHGTYTTVDGRPALRFERRYPHAVEVVWRAISEPDQLAHWFPSRVTIDELRVGAPIGFAFEDHDLPPMEGEITALDAPRLLAFAWGDDVLRFELEPADDGAATLLTFTTLLGAEDTAARNAAGWHVCLSRLEQQLAGRDVNAPDTGVTPEWEALYEQYRLAGVPAGAPIPGRA